MSRRAVTLIELLMSIFVLSIGILGIFAMLSLGHKMEREIDRHDSVAACGKACLARVAMIDGTDRRTEYYPDANGVLQPRVVSEDNYQAFVRPAEPITGWTSPDVGRFFHDAATYPHTEPGQPTMGYTSIRLNPTTWIQTSLPTLIDPIGYSRNAGTDFPPANASEPRELLSDTTDPLSVAIPRVTPRTWGPGGTRQPMPLALAERAFSWSDDVVVPIPDDGSRPKQLYQKDAKGNPLVGQSDGAYTWAVMVQPADEVLGKPARLQTKFRVWVLVYQRRVIGPSTPPVERTVVANLTGGGTNGGDCKLTTSISGDYLAVRKDRWILLVGVDSLRRVRCEWYQIRTIDREATEEAPGRWAVYARLAGPDWPVAWCDKRQDGSLFDLDQDGTAADVLAVIVEDLVGVHQGDGRYVEIPKY